MSHQQNQAGYRTGEFNTTQSPDVHADQQEFGRGDLSIQNGSEHMMQGESQNAPNGYVQRPIMGGYGQQEMMALQNYQVKEMRPQSVGQVNVVNSLKQRLHTITAANAASNIYNQEKKAQLTRSELKQLKKLGQNRELLQMMERTTTNRIAGNSSYLRGRLASAAGQRSLVRSGSRQGSRSNSRSGVVAQRSGMVSAKSKLSSTIRTKKGSRNMMSMKFTDSLTNYGTTHQGLNSKGSNAFYRRPDPRKSNSRITQNISDAMSNEHAGFSSDEDPGKGDQMEADASNAQHQMNSFRGGQGQGQLFKIRQGTSQNKQKKRIMSAQNYGGRKRMLQTNRDQSIKQVFNQSISNNIPTKCRSRFNDLKMIHSLKASQMIPKATLDEAEQIMAGYRLNGVLYSSQQQSVDLASRGTEGTIPQKARGAQIPAASAGKSGAQDGKMMIQDNMTATATDNVFNSLEQRPTVGTCNNLTAELDLSQFTLEQRGEPTVPDGRSQLTQKPAAAGGDGDDGVPDIRRFSRTQDPTTPEQAKLGAQKMKESASREQELEQQQFHQEATPQAELQQQQALLEDAQYQSNMLIRPDYSQSQPTFNSNIGLKKPRLKSGVSSKNRNASNTKKANNVMQAYSTTAANAPWPTMPTKVAQAPQFKIRELKDQTDAVLKKNLALKAQIEKFDIQYKKLANDTKTLKEKSAQCTADKFEIMRDLATYEANYANWDPLQRNVHKPFKQRFLGLVEQLMMVKNKCSQTLKHDGEGGQYFTDSSVSEPSQRTQEGEAERAELVEQSKYQQLDGQLYKDGQEISDVPGIIHEERAGRPQQAQEQAEAAMAGSYDASQPMASGAGRVPRKGWLRARQLDHIVTNLERLQIVKRSRVQTRIQSGDGSSRRQSTDKNIVIEHHKFQDSNIKLITTCELEEKYQTQMDTGKTIQEVILPSRFSNYSQQTGGDGTPKRKRSAAAAVVRKGRKPFNHHYQMDADLIKHHQIHHQSPTKEMTSGPQNHAHSPPAKGTAKPNAHVNAIHNHNHNSVVDESEKEHLFTPTVISGVPCVVGCTATNDSIRGHVISKLIDERTKFEMKPIYNQRFQAVDLELEIKRLYFDITLSDTGEEKVVLRIRDPSKPGIKDQGVNFIVTIPGGQSKYQSLFIMKHEDKVKLRMDITYAQANKNVELQAPQTAVFEEEMDLNQFQNLEVDNNDLMASIAKYVQANMEITQKPDGAFQMLTHEKTIEFHRAEIETLYKSKYQSLYSKYSQHANVAQKAVVVAQHTKNKVSQLPPAQTFNFDTADQEQSKPITELPPRAKRSITQSMEVREVQDLKINSAQMSRRKIDPEQQSKEEPKLEPILFEKFDIYATQQHARARSSLQIHGNVAFGDLGGAECNTVDQIDYAAKSPTKTERSLTKEESNNVAMKERDSEQYSDIDKSEIQKQLQELRRRRDSATEREEIAQEDLDIERYDVLYGLRTLKAQKRYAYNLKQRANKIKFEIQRKEEQEFLIQRYAQNINAKVEAKSRRDDQQDPHRKRKYFRQTRIYQNNYINQLHDQNQVLEYHEEEEFHHQENHTILYLFVKEQDQVFLFLGREKSKDESRPSKSSHQEKSEKQSHSEISNTSSKFINASEKDDDSPYFVKINLDDEFLSYLQEPSLVASSEIDSAKMCQLIRRNAVFKQIVASEMTARFSRKIAVGIQNHAQDAAKAHAKPEGPEQGRKYSPINEESSEGMTQKQLKEGQGSKRDLQRQKSMDSVAGHSGLRMNVEIGDSPNESQTKMKNTRDSVTNSAHDAGSAALKLRGVPVLKSMKLDEAAQTPQTPRQPDAQAAFGGSIDLVNQLNITEADMDKRAQNAPNYMPRFKKLQQNPSSIFENEMNKKVESFSVVLNYKSAV